LPARLVCRMHAVVAQAGPTWDRRASALRPSSSGESRTRGRAELRACGARHRTHRGGAADLDARGDGRGVAGGAEHSVRRTLGPPPWWRAPRSPKL
jgi:hypothetical protein